MLRSNVKIFKSLNKIQNLNKKLDEIKNNDEISIILYKMRVIHGVMLEKLHKHINSPKKRTTKEYYNTSIYHSLINNIENIISDAEDRLNIDGDSKKCILFYAPWCGYCKQFMPAWNKFEEKMKNKINIEKIDCVENPEQCKKYDIQGYPTIKLVNGNKITEFNGPRNVESLIKFVSTAL